MNTRNDPETFGELIFSTLKAYVNDWVGQLAEDGLIIEEVRLFHAPFEESRPYALLFFLPHSLNLDLYQKFLYRMHGRLESYKTRKAWEKRFSEVYRKNHGQIVVVEDRWSKEWSCDIVTDRKIWEDQTKQNNWLLYGTQTETIAGDKDFLDARQYGYSFFKRGDVWMVGEFGKEVAVKHSKGMEFIQSLLKNPGTAIPAKELYHTGKSPTGTSPPPAPKPGGPEKQDQIIEYMDTASERSQLEPVIDDTARKEAKNALKRLEERIAAETEEEEKHRLETQRDKFSRYLRDSTAKTYSAQDTNARTNVQKRIKSAIDRISDHGLTAIVAELKLITTGHSLLYPGHATWKLSDE